MEDRTGNTGKRIEYIDLAKGICILLVVFFHVSLHYHLSLSFDTVIRSFRMPLYFILSGLFFKPYEGFGGFLRRKTNKLLIPFLFFYLISVIMMTALSTHTFWYWLGSFIYREEFDNVPIWFLFCLFEVNVIFYSLTLLSQKTNHPKGSLLVFCAFCGLLGMFLSWRKINLYAFLDSALSAIPFFFTGWYLGRESNLLRRPIKVSLGCLIIAISLLFVVLFAGFVDYKSNTFSDKAYLTAYPCGIVGTLMVLTIAKLVNKLPLVSYWGRYSIIVLCTHMPIYQALGRVLDYVGITGGWGFVVDFLGTMLIELAVIPFCIRFLPYVTAQKDVLKGSIADYTVNA